MTKRGFDMLVIDMLFYVFKTTPLKSKVTKSLIDNVVEFKSKNLPGQKRAEVMLEEDDASIWVFF